LFYYILSYIGSKKKTTGLGKPGARSRFTEPVVSGQEVTAAVDAAVEAAVEAAAEAATASARTARL
jgi:hypothetical protein